MFLLFVAFCLAHAAGFAKESHDTTIYFDFKQMIIAAPGLYTPNVDGKHSSNTIQAEVVARANGIKAITDYLTQSCQNAPSDIFGLKPKFAREFHSQGTEIYSNGVLQVNLIAAYGSVFHLNTGSNLKTESGESLVFSMPSSIPANAVKCGAPSLEFTDNTHQKIQIQMIPANQTPVIAANERLIKLMFDKQKNALVLENPEDAVLLRTLGLNREGKTTAYIPITVYTAQK